MNFENFANKKDAEYPLFARREGTKEVSQKNILNYKVKPVQRKVY